jgi:peptide/nickel transport system permease protein
VSARAWRHATGILLVAVPLLIALFGPLLAGSPSPRAAAFVVDEAHRLGTDFVGRDVVDQTLRGGRSVVLIAAAATIVTYLLAVPPAFLAAMTWRRWLDELLMRPLDVLLAIPALLLVLLIAGLAPPSASTLVLVVALVNVPSVARLARSAALDVASRPALEAMRLQGESWWRMGLGYVGRSVVRVLAADVGLRLTSALYLVASASFLGVGVAPDAANWAVMVDRNQPGLFLAPWGVVLPALLIIALAVGTSLVFDRGLERG